MAFADTASADSDVRAVRLADNVTNDPNMPGTGKVNGEHGTRLQAKAFEGGEIVPKTALPDCGQSYQAGDCFKCLPGSGHTEDFF